MTDIDYESKARHIINQWSWEQCANWLQSHGYCVYHSAHIEELRDTVADQVIEDSEERRLVEFCNYYGDNK